ncbi:MAG: hypothetical protein WC823_01565 [Parcubacteria group bacterium]|jgi:hypothetical protein
MFEFILINKKPGIIILKKDGYGFVMRENKRVKNFVMVERACYSTDYPTCDNGWSEWKKIEESLGIVLLFHCDQTAHGIDFLGCLGKNVFDYISSIPDEDDEKVVNMIRSIRWGVTAHQLLRLICDEMLNEAAHHLFHNLSATIKIRRENGKLAIK